MRRNERDWLSCADISEQTERAKGTRRSQLQLGQNIGNWSAEHLSLLLASVAVATSAEVRNMLCCPDPTILQLRPQVPLALMLSICSLI